MFLLDMFKVTKARSITYQTLLLRLSTLKLVQGENRRLKLL